MLLQYPKSIISILAISLLTACGGGSDPVITAQNQASERPTPVFTVLENNGIEFQHGYLNRFNSDPENFAGGAAAGDYDNDGDIDLFIVRGDVGPNLLYRNNGDGTFVEVANTATAVGSATRLDYTKSATENYRHSGPTFADMDNDGDLDLFFGGIYDDPSFIFRNNLIGLNEATFTDVTPAAIRNMTSAFTISAAFGDYDLDGDLDMMLAHWGTVRIDGAEGDTETLWNNNDGAFDYVSVSESTGINEAIIINPNPPFGVFGNDHDYTFTPTFAKIDGDNYPDILSVADFNRSQFFANNAGTLTDATPPGVFLDTNGMGSAVGDYDNDGDLDWFVSSIFDFSLPTGNQLYRNNNGVFENVTEEAGIRDGGWGWGACFADFDADGNLDIYHTNGWENFRGNNYEADTSRLFISNGDGTFTDQAFIKGADNTWQGRGVVCADFDGDNDVDIFETYLQQSSAGRLIRNDHPNTNILSVTLQGNAIAPNNTQAAGARIIAEVAGMANQMREITIGSNFISQNSTTQFFGLAGNTQVDTLTITWPDGTQDIYTNIAAGGIVCTQSPAACN